MKLLVFDWKGKMGHFRKLDTNSSSLTYSFPNRTTITGMIAGVLGYKKDTYYDLFSPEKCHIALNVRTPVRKVIQTVNYLFMTTKADVNGVKGHTQIPIEFLFPTKNNKEIVYRIYFWHEDKGIYEKLKEHIQLKKAIYPPYMGLSELLSSLEYVQETEGERIEPSHYPVKFQSVVRIRELKELSLESMSNPKFVKEFMTRYFEKGRNIAETDNYLLEENNQLVGIPKVPYYRTKLEDENILFM